MLKGENVLIRRFGWALYIGFLVVVLAGCLDATGKELMAYINEDRLDLAEKTQDTDKYVEEYVNHVINLEPEKGFEILSERLIPEREKVLEEFDKVELKEEIVIDLHNLFRGVIEADLNRQMAFKDLFADMMDGNEMTEGYIDEKLKGLHGMNEAFREANEILYDELEQLIEEYELEWEDEDALTLETLKIEDMNEQTDGLVSSFIVGMDLNGQEDIAEAGSETNDEDTSNDKDDKDSVVSEELLAGRGNPEIVFDGGVEIKDEFHLSGRTNLIEGSMLNLTIYEFGSENPYIKGEMEVDASGNFGAEIDIEADELKGMPMEVHVGYHPEHQDDPEAQELYGEEGEKLTGSFIHKYTNIKRTRYGAFAHAYIELNPEATASFVEYDWEKPDDYGEMDIWMEADKVEKKDGYYDITMKSNMNELSYIKAEATVPGYETAGYRSRTKVLQDGSFRIQVPRPEIEDELVVVMIEGHSDLALETEALYGEHGEHLEGDLTEKTKRGKKIVYELEISE